MITAKEAKKYVQSHLIGIFRTTIQLYPDPEDSHKRLLDSIDWAVKRESSVGRSMVILDLVAPISVNESIDIYKIVDFLQENGFYAFINGSISCKQIEFIIEW